MTLKKFLILFAIVTCSAHVGQAKSLDPYFWSVSSVYAEETKKSNRFHGVGVIVDVIGPATTLSARNDVGEQKHQVKKFLMTVSHVASGEQLRVQSFSKTLGQLQVVKTYNYASEDLVFFEIKSSSLVPAALVFKNKKIEVSDEFRAAVLNGSNASDGLIGGISKFETGDSILLHPSSSALPKTVRAKSKTNYLRSGDFRGVQHFSIVPGVSGSSLFQKQTDRFEFIGLASQFDRVMNRSYYTSRIFAQEIMDKILSGDAEFDLTSWKYESCNLFRTRGNLTERVSLNPGLAGGFDTGDGGGFDTGDGGGFDTGDVGDSQDCQRQDASQALDTVLQAIPGLGVSGQKDIGESVIALKTSLPDEDGSIHMLADSLSFSLFENGIFLWNELRSQLVKLKDLDLLHFFDERAFAWKRRTRDIDQMSAFHTEYVCSNGGVVHWSGQTGSPAVVFVDRKKQIINFEIEIRSCTQEKLRLKFPISAKKLLESKNTLDSHSVGQWLVKKVVAKGSRSDMELLVDLRNFWFSNVNEPLLHFSLQVRPVDQVSSDNQWWGSFSFGFPYLD